jgi:hypothetical protein
MGSDVAYELFKIEELDGQEDFVKTGYSIFARISIAACTTACSSSSDDDDDSRGRDVLFRSFPVGYQLKSTEVPICRHQLILDVDSDAFERNTEYKKHLQEPSLESFSFYIKTGHFIGHLWVL